MTLILAPLRVEGIFYEGVRAICHTGNILNGGCHAYLIGHAEYG